MTRAPDLATLARDAAKRYFSPLGSLKGWRRSAALHDPVFQRLAEDFVKLAASGGVSIDRDSQRAFQSLFVKTWAYSQVRARNASIVIGPPGSGKSTLVSALHALSGHAVLAIDFSAEIGDRTASALSQRDLRLHGASLPQKVGHLLGLVWELFFFLIYFGHVRTGARAAPANDSQLKALLDFESELEKSRLYAQTGNTFPVSSSAAMTASFALVTAFWEETLAPARSNRLEARDYTNDLIRFAVGEPAQRRAEVLSSLFDERLLVAIDSLDDGLSRTLELADRGLQAETHQEVSPVLEFLTALLNFVAVADKTASRGNFGSKLDFCVTLTPSSYARVLHQHRDAYRFERRSVAIRWTGIELAILLRKRLELLLDTSTDRSSSPAGRLTELLQLARLPSTLSIPHNKGSIQVDLFPYVLRSTLWRPREVLHHFARLLAATRGRQEPLSSDMVRKILRDTSYDLVSRELLPELRDVDPALEDVVLAFRGTRARLSYEEIAALLSDVARRTMDAAQAHDAPAKWIVSLYRLGFLGFQAPADLREQLLLLHQHSFTFNEGQAIDRLVSSSYLRRVDFIIHPVYADYLAIDTDAGDPVLLLDWQYLSEAEALQLSRSL